MYEPKEFSFSVKPAPKPVQISYRERFEFLFYGVATVMIVYLMVVNVLLRIS